MTIYTCKPCKFHTDKKTDYTRHTNSKKHLQNVSQSSNGINAIPIEIQFDPIENYSCDYCSISFSSKSNKTKHMKKCATSAIIKEKDKEIAEKEKEIVQKEKFIELAQKDNEIAQKDIALAQKEKEIELINKYADMLKMENERLNILLKTALQKPSQNNVTYISNTFTNSPAIGELLTYDVILKAKTLSLVDVVCMYYEQGTLCQFISDFLINSYVKKDANDQSLWTTDITRLTYIINELQDSGKIKWIVDKKGIKTKQYIVNPLLQYIRDELNKYMIVNSKTTKEHILKRLLLITEIYTIIDKDILATEVIRYMAPYFTLIRETEQIANKNEPLKITNGDQK